MIPCHFSCLSVVRCKTLKAFLNLPISCFKFGLESDFFQAQSTQNPVRCFQADVLPPKKVRRMEPGLFRRSMAQPGNGAEHPKGLKCPSANTMLWSRAKRSALPLNSQSEKKTEIMLGKKKKFRNGSNLWGDILMRNLKIPKENRAQEF